MKTHIVREGNAFYEVDEECILEKEKVKRRVENEGKAQRQISGKRSRQR